MSPNLSPNATPEASRGQLFLANPLIYLVGAAGIEPATT